jgi:phosphoglycolate phosphatase
MKQAFELAYEQTEQALQDIDWNSYGSILFISKSIGTVIASAYASRHNIKGKSILFTPLTDTFSFARPGSIAFHGTADPWAETGSIRTLAEQKEVPLFLTPNANHSLETGDVQADLSIIKATMEHVNRFIATP